MLGFACGGGGGGRIIIVIVLEFFIVLVLVVRVVIVVVLLLLSVHIIRIVHFIVIVFDWQTMLVVGRLVCGRLCGCRFRCRFC